MTDTDRTFAGTIPSNYERYLVPLIFQPYAIDLGERLAALLPKDILEIAAGTGVVTAELVRQLGPEVTITATDLNPAMIEIAAKKVTAGNVTFQPADAMALPFADASFDAVVCQFGAMFFPDKVHAYREAHRVLRPGGHFLFNVWGAIERNEFTAVIMDSVAAGFPGNPPQFLRRTPHGYYDVTVIRDELEEAGFDNAAILPLFKRSIAPSPREPAIGFCHGTPLYREIMDRAPDRLEAITDAAAKALAARFGGGPVDGALEAIVIEARATAA